MPLQGRWLTCALLIVTVKSGDSEAVPLTRAEICQLCGQVTAIFLSQSTLLELVAPINICGKYFSLFMLALIVYLYWL